MYAEIEYVCGMCLCVCMGMHVECMDCMWTGFVLPLLKAPAADGL